VQLRTWLKSALDFCFPGTCAVCKAESDGTSPLCHKCLLQLDSLVTAPSCDRCAAPLAYPAAPCPHCRGEGVRSFNRVVAIGLFDEPIRTMIHSIKYHRAWPLAEYLADCLLARERAKALLTETEVLVPVPLHPLRQMSRGYNQAALLAERIGRVCKLKQANALVRLRHTEAQTNLHSRAKRDANLKDAFALASERGVRGRHVVLVDDVMTTGATLRAAARAVRKAKPKSLSVLVLAVADPRGHHFQSV
jgi:ComF family protein